MANIYLASKPPEINHNSLSGVIRVNIAIAIVATMILTKSFASIQIKGKVMNEIFTVSIEISVNILTAKKKIKKVFIQ